MDCGHGISPEVALVLPAFGYKDMPSRSAVRMVDSVVMTAEILSQASGHARILVVRVGALGDTLMVTPLLRLLHERQPQAEIDFLCSDLAAPLLELNPYVSHLHRLRGRNLPLALSFEKRRLVRQLRARDYDLAVLLESAPRYRILTEQARPRQIRSFAEVPFNPNLHAIVNNLNAADIHDAKIEDLNMDLPLASDDEARADRVLADLPQPRIGVHIGWGPQGRKKLQAQRLRGWSHAGFIQLIRMLLDHDGISVVLTGSSEDARDTEAICRQMPGGRVQSIAGRTRVRELAAVIKKLDLLISVDSGPCHMAAALGTPLVVVWGPGRLEQTRPVSSITPVRLVRHPVPCAPCQSTPLQKTCRRNICMELITPEEVFAAAQSLLTSLPGIDRRDKE
ncbi:MAG: glycosyltransferase family 9 protein [Acidobacteriia bacterium]|nr:glycosyltransferase family 9 protein [Terriglobia bacterium]